MQYGVLKATSSNLVCVVGDGDGTITKKVDIPVGKPDSTIEAVNDFFIDNEPEKLVIISSSNGPLDVDPTSKTYGYIVNADVAGWENCDFIENFEAGLRVSIMCDPDEEKIEEALKKAAE